MMTATILAFVNLEHSSKDWAVLAAFVLPPRSYARQPLARFAHLQANTQVFTHTHTPKA